MAEIFNWKHYKPTGTRAVDVVAACIAWHRERGMPLKAIHLKPMAYEQFAYYFKEQGADTQGFAWDAVNIEKGSVLQPNTILCEFYTLQPAEA